jgi:hypothetical protein
MLPNDGLLVERVDWHLEETVAGDYEDALSAFETWKAAEQPITVRCAALASALKTSTWARISWEWGARAESVQALRLLLQLLRERHPVLRERFWPAASRFDGTTTSDQSPDWF